MQIENSNNISLVNKGNLENLQIDNIKTLISDNIQNIIIPGYYKNIKITFGKKNVINDTNSENIMFFISEKNDKYNKLQNLFEAYYDNDENFKIFLYKYIYYSNFIYLITFSTILIQFNIEYIIQNFLELEIKKISKNLNTTDKMSLIIENLNLYKNLF